MINKLARVLTIALAVSLMLPVAFASEDIQTPGEITKFQSGATMYDDMMKFVYELDSKSDLMQVKKVTRTLRGRDVVLCIMSNPPIYQPSDIMGSDKPIVLIVNNVHGGEVAGREASLILMRDLLFGELRPLLDKVVVLNIPPSILMEPKSAGGPTSKAST